MMVTFALALGVGGVAPVFANGSSCDFQAASVSLNFGTLDPSQATLVNAQTNSTAGNCVNVTMAVSADDGQNFSGGTRRLRNAAGDFIPYALSGTNFTRAAPGNNTQVPFTISGSILGSAYANASAGAYSDQVVLTVMP